MAYALLTEGMSLEGRAAFDQMLNAPPEQTAAGPAGPDVAAQNREFVRSLAGLGVHLPGVKA